MSFQKVIEDAYISGKLLQYVQDNTDLKSVCNILGYSNHGRNTTALRLFCNKNGIDISHFHTLSAVPIIEDRECPVCKKIFSVRITRKKESEQITCSHSCANTYFRSGRDAGAYKGKESESCRSLAKHLKLDTCCICGEQEVIDIHHLDHDRSNNDQSNLVPLCPTHHAYIHRGKIDLIIDKLTEYLDNK